MTRRLSTSIQAPSGEPPPQLPTLPPGPLTLAAARQLGLSDHQWRLKGLRRQTQTVRTLTEPQ